MTYRRQAIRRPGTVHARRDPAGHACLSIFGLVVALALISLALGIAVALGRLWL